MKNVADGSKASFRPSANHFWFTRINGHPRPARLVHFVPKSDVFLQLRNIEFSQSFSTRCVMIA